MLLFTSELKGFLHLQNVLHQKYHRVVFTAFYFNRIFPNSPRKHRESYQKRPETTRNDWYLEQQRQASCDSAATHWKCRLFGADEPESDRRLTARFCCIQLVLSRRPSVNVASSASLGRVSLRPRGGAFGLVPVGHLQTSSLLWCSGSVGLVRVFGETATFIFYSV